MDRLIAALSANLPGGYGASGAVQRQASFFGRFCEELIRVSETGEAEEEEEEEGYCRRKMREAWELLCKEDDELRDPTGSLLRGLADILTYIAMVRPEVFGEEPETQEDEMADLSDLVGGRISLLARSRHPLNVISYLTSMTTFAPLVEDQLSLLLGNSLVKVWRWRANGLVYAVDGGGIARAGGGGGTKVCTTGGACGGDGKVVDGGDGPETGPPRRPDRSLSCVEDAATGIHSP